jgi:hypothetical protein
VTGYRRDYSLGYYKLSAGFSVLSLCEGMHSSGQAHVEYVKVDVRIAASLD